MIRSVYRITTALERFDDIFPNCVKIDRINFSHGVLPTKLRVVSQTRNECALIEARLWTLTSAIGVYPYAILDRMCRVLLNSHLCGR